MRYKFDVRSSIKLIDSLTFFALLRPPIKVPVFTLLRALYEYSDAINGTKGSSLDRRLSRVREVEVNEMRTLVAPRIRRNASEKAPRKSSAKNFLCVSRISRVSNVHASHLQPRRLCVKFEEFCRQPWLPGKHVKEGAKGRATKQERVNVVTGAHARVFSIRPRIGLSLQS